MRPASLLEKLGGKNERARVGGAGAGAAGGAGSVGGCGIVAAACASACSMCGGIIGRAAANCGGKCAAMLVWSMAARFAG